MDERATGRAEFKTDPVVGFTNSSDALQKMAEALVKTYGAVAADYARSQARQAETIHLVAMWTTIEAKVMAIRR